MPRFDRIPYQGRAVQEKNYPKYPAVRKKRLGDWKCDGEHSTASTRGPPPPHQIFKGPIRTPTARASFHHFFHPQTSTSSITTATRFIRHQTQTSRNTVLSAKKFTQEHHQHTTTPTIHHHPPPIPLVTQPKNVLPRRNPAHKPARRPIALGRRRREIHRRATDNVPMR